MGLYIHPLVLVTPNDLNLTRRASQVVSNPSNLARVISNTSGISGANLVASTTTTTATASESGISTLDTREQDKKSPATTSPIDIISPPSFAEVAMSNPINANKPSVSSPSQKSAVEKLLSGA